MTSNSTEPSLPNAKAPVSLTGGGGFRFENEVAARLLLDMLGATNVLGAAFGAIVRLDWQARDSGWLADDLVATCETNIGLRTAAVSLKSGQSVTTHGFPNDFVELAWHQWKQTGTTRDFQNSNDVIVLATGNGKATAVSLWVDLLTEIIVGDPVRVVERVNSKKEEGSQSSKENREIFSAFVQTPETQEETAKLLSHIRWHDFDCLADNSRATVTAINDCKVALDPSQVSQAESLWKRLIEIADELRPKGGTITLAKLYTKLPGFRFNAKPEIEGDWKILDRRSELDSAVIKPSVGSQPPIDRNDVRNQVLASLKTISACLMVGDSGSGKSALAKEISKGIGRVIWLTADTCDHAALPDLEQALGLSQDFIRLINATPEPVCVVFDAIEGFGGNALKVAAQLTAAIQKSDSGERTKILLTSQTTGTSVIMAEFNKAGFPKDFLGVEPIDRPDLASVRALVAGLPKVGWVALSPDVRSLLSNLKVLDWFVDFAESGGALGTGEVGLTNLIDSIWAHWIGTDGDRFARSGLLQTVASIEASRHIASVPVADLAHPEKTTLGKLTSDDLLRVQSNRIKFAHDLISDWARYNVLLDGDWFDTKEKREKYVRPRWARAVRLYAQRLLEQNNDGGESWRKKLEATQDGTATGTLIRDLFLEALFLAPNAEALLRQAWPVLIAKKGELLAVLLKRFLYAGTYPDPRLSDFFPEEEKISDFEHLLRIPYWPYWGPVLSVLHEKMAEAVDLIPHGVAKVASLWLRVMNFEPRPGYKIKWRSEAAALALAAARKVQSWREQGNYWSQGKDKDVFEAALYAADELPAEIGQLCLELAKRRDLSPEVATAVATALAKQEQERKRQESETPRQRRRSMPAMIFPLGEESEPYPDGPRERVEEDFQNAVLEGGSFAAFAKANPTAAVEVLLAVCIEPPERVYSGSTGMHDYGLNWWTKGEPAMWWRGPFYAFLNAAADDAIGFIIRLCNFAASQSGRSGGLAFNIEGTERFWIGDENFFLAHYEGYISHGSTLQSSLMALEKWLYDRLDRNEDVTPAIERILRESTSLAFAGLLVCIGKKNPDLFLGPLRPLIEKWQLWDIDTRASYQRANGLRGPSGFFRPEGAHAYQMLQDWIRMPHRMFAARDLLCRDYLSQPANRPFFAALKAGWEKQYEEEGKPDELAQLIAMIDPANYTYAEKDGKTVPISFELPAADAAKVQTSANAVTHRIQYLTFPSQCRKALDEGQNLAGQDLTPFFERIKVFYSDKDVGEGSDGLNTKEDLVLGGVAVLIVLGYDWLRANPKAMKWCRARLEEEPKSIEHQPRFYNDVNVGNDKRDAFSAEAAIVLLAKDPSDSLAKGLVARAVTAFFYSTTALVMNRAALYRDALGEDFGRIVRLALEWAALRSKLNQILRTLTTELAKVTKERETLRKSFVSGKLPATLPNITTLNEATRKAVEELFDKAHPEHAKFREARRNRKRADGERQSPEQFGLDEHLLRAAFGWIDLPNVREKGRRAETIGVIKTLLSLVLNRFPTIPADSREELEGYPGDFDTWVFEIVAQAIVDMSDAEKPEELWQPILDLGPHANDWVERFFIEFFTHGFKVRADLTAFARRWRQIIEYALASPKWDTKVNWHHRVDDVVKEIIGVNYTFTPFSEATFELYFPDTADLFEKAAAKWFHLDEVLHGFVYHVQKPAAASLVVKSISWTAKHVIALHDYSWRDNMEESVISYLGVCWRLGAKDITNDPKLNADFFNMLNVVVARQNHAAIALRDRIAQQAQG